MADVAALMLEFNDSVHSKTPNTYPSRSPAPSTFSPNPEPPLDRYNPVTYTYRVTTPEAKQATLNCYLGLGDYYLPINHPPKDHQDRDKKEEEPENMAYYKLMAAYEQGPSSRKRGEQFADEYVQYCLQQSEGKASPPAPPPPAGKRNVCNSCLRPFDDGYYKPASPAASPDSKMHFDASVAKSTSASLGSDSGISFDVDLGTWRVHFERNSEQQEALCHKAENKEERESRLVAESKFADEWEDGGYVDYHNHLNQLRGNEAMSMPVRTKKVEEEKKNQGHGTGDVPPAVRLACEKAAMGDSEGSYEEYAAYINALRGNHVVVAPAEPSSESSKTQIEVEAEEKTVTTGDVMGDYKAYLDVLRRNHVVIAPSETTQSSNKVDAKAEVNAAASAASGDVMGDCERYLNVLRGNHVVVTSPETTTKKSEAKVEATTAGDVMADYDAFLRNNHVVVPPPKSQSQPTDEELAERAAAGDIMTGYDDFLRSNHVVVATTNITQPTTKPEPEPGSSKTTQPDVKPVATKGDVMADYDAFLRSNHVVVPSNPQPQTTDVERAERAAAGDFMAGYDDFLRANHVVLGQTESVDGKSTTAAVEKRTTMVVDVDDDEDLDMDYVDVCDEEYADYLAANHVTVVKHTEVKTEEKTVETETETQPVVNVGATSYENSHDVGNVGPAAGPPW